MSDKKSPEIEAFIHVGAIQILGFFLGLMLIILLPGTSTFNYGSSFTFVGLISTIVCILTFLYIYWHVSDRGRTILGNLRIERCLIWKEEPVKLIQYYVLVNIILLGILIWQTGGPVESVFLPQFLVILPLIVPLEPNRKRQLRYLGFVFFASFFLFLPDMLPDDLKGRLRSDFSPKPLYYGLYLTATTVCTFFPVLADIRAPVVTTKSPEDRS